MTILKTTIISILALFSLNGFSDYLFLGYDSIYVQGYVKSCKDTLSCELEFFNLKVYPDLTFILISNDSSYTSINHLEDKPQLFSLPGLFTSDFEMDTIKKEKENFVLLKSDSFTDTLVYKPKQTLFSSYRFTRNNFPMIAYFTNLSLFRDLKENLK
ncbi:MAG: hypothetical protein PHW02_06820 [bacterium]|nr:hypothetical protein [bacterium]